MRRSGQLFYAGALLTGGLHGCGWHLDITKMAQDIAARTMRIIDTNINVMDARGRIIGDRESEIGELHEGRCWCFPRGGSTLMMRVARHLHGASGDNLPGVWKGDFVGDRSDRRTENAARKYGELVCMTAEMMLEQVVADASSGPDSRLREELVMNLDSGRREYAGA